MNGWMAGGLVFLRFGQIGRVSVEKEDFLLVRCSGRFLCTA
jgi:hypothetical protein